MVRPPPAITIIIAVKEAEANLHELLERLSPAKTDEVQYIFVVAGDPPADLAGLGDIVEVVGAPAGTLVPVLWRDGIRRARGHGVALTTAQCLPPRGWVAALLAADLANFVGVGGPIDLYPGNGPAHRAIYFLRYLAFTPPQTKREVFEIAADNAIYRRAEILQHEDLLAEGFWEPSFHRRFRQQHLGLQLDPELCIAYRGCEPPEAFPRHRHSHGRAYGRWRAEQVSLPRQVALVLVSPLLPAVLLLRVLRRAWAHPQFRASSLPALPWLMLFILAWSTGEARGYLAATKARLGGRRRRNLRSAS